MPKKLFFLAAILIFVFGLFLTGCSLTPNSKQNTTNTEDQNVRRDNREGGVQVEATWMAPGHISDSSNKELISKYDLNTNIIFKIAMTTHMGDLTQYPILNNAELTVDGKVIKPAKWEYSSNSAHHPQGLLIFAAKDGNGNALVKPGSKLELVLKDLQDVPERKFAWEQK